MGETITRQRPRKGIVYLIDIALAAVLVTTIITLSPMDSKSIGEAQELATTRKECRSVLETAWNTGALSNPTNQSIDEWLNNTLGPGYRYTLLVERYSGNPPRLERIVAVGPRPPEETLVASCKMSRVVYKEGEIYYYEARGWAWH